MQSRRRARWIFSRSVDLTVFLGSALLSITLLLGGRVFGLHRRPVQPAAWLLLIVFLDVAHVWSTLFRVYLDRHERRRRRVLYTVVPMGCYASGVALYAIKPAVFWTCLAYLAVFHFVRQQYGWVVLYRRRNGEKGGVGEWLDAGMIYVATLHPIVWWHAHLPRSFEWLVQGDFAFRLPLRVAEFSRAVHITVTVAWLLWQAVTLVRDRWLHTGKLIVVVGTWLCWYLGIVATNDDWSFTVTNVIIHAVPYFALVTLHARASETRVRQEDQPFASRSLRQRLLRYGVLGVVALACTLALAEEWFWDQFVWHERSRLFGDVGFRPSSVLLALVVPLLALPQSTHYMLDAWIWRMNRNNPELRDELWPGEKGNRGAVGRR